MLKAKGPAVEIGVWNGGTAQIIQKELGGELHLFDTFTGITGYQAEEGWPDGQYRAELSEVKLNVPGAVFHKGDITINKDEAPLKIAFVHFDLDVFLPLKASLKFFYDRLEKGGVMLVSNVDDAHPGVQRAVKEFGLPYKTYSRYALYGKN